MVLDAEAIRRDFPVLTRDHSPRPPLVYLDSGCMSLKPTPVIEAVSEYYTQHSACSGRSIHALASEVTRRVERTRATVARLIGAPRPEGVVFTRNTTESINLVAHGLGLGRGDGVVISDREHNSNMVPWLRLRETAGIDLTILPSEDDGTLDTDRMADAVSGGGVRLVSMAHTTNLDGYTMPMEAISDIAHDAGALVFADAAQSVPNRPVDVGALSVDLLAFSVHKMLGPTGVGVLWGRQEVLEGLDPYNVGGDTVVNVTRGGAEYQPPPHRFEAGLQDYAGIYGTEAAVAYLRELGLDQVWAHDVALNARATEAVADIPGVSVVGPADPAERSGILTLAVEGVASHEVGMAMDEIGNVAVRTGQHCNHAWFAEHGMEGAVRATFYVYNTPGDVDVFARVLEEALEALRGA
ncbi:MAG: cysteine desulfurase [Thermoplasmata archaeon]|nr:MAG: cysteine desulfurase [Thermoplasmata archaeon]